MKNLAIMKKELRFKLPCTPLKVLRGEKDGEDIRDRFQVPDTTTEDAEDNRDIDDESRRSSVSRDYVITDIGEASDEGNARYPGRDTSSIESIDSNSHEKQGNPNNVDIVLKDDTTGSVNLEAADNDNYNDGDTNVYSKRSNLQRDEVNETNDDKADNTDVYSDRSSLRQDDTIATREDTTYSNDNDDDHDNDNASREEARNPDNEDTNIDTGIISEEDFELQVMGQGHHPPNKDNSDEKNILSNDESIGL